MFPKIRLVNGRAITVESTAAGLRAAPVTGAVGSHAAGLRVAPDECVERRAGTLKICSVITGTWRVRQGKKGTSNASVLVASSSTSPFWTAKASPPRSVPPVLLLTRLLGLLLSLSRKWTRFMIRTRLFFFERLWRCFENCNLPPGVLDEIRKIVPPHRPPTRKAPKVSREQIVLNMKKET